MLVNLGDHLTATAQENQLNGKNGIYDIEVKNQEGVTVALFRGHSHTIRGQVIETEEDYE